MDIKVKSHLKPCAAVSIAIIIVALVMTLTGHGMNLGVDFTGGTIMTYNMGEQFETADVEAVLAENGITDAQIAKTGEDDTQVQIRISDKETPMTCAPLLRASSARNTPTWNMSISPALAQSRVVTSSTTPSRA